jgi:hypothetical protein
MSASSEWTPEAEAEFIVAFEYQWLKDHGIAFAELKSSWLPLFDPMAQEDLGLVKTLLNVVSALAVSPRPAGTGLTSVAWFVDPMLQ